VSELSIIAIPLAIAVVVLLLGFVGCDMLFGITHVDPLPPQPEGRTQPATDKSCHGATLNGQVNSEGQPTTYQFEYGTTPAFGSKTAPMIGPSGSSFTWVNAPISDLTPGTSYYFVLRAATGAYVDLTADTLMFSTLQPLGFWPLDDAPGPTAADKSPSGFNGTYIGGVTPVNDLAAAGAATAASFDGTGYIEVPFQTALNHPSFRIDALAQVTTLGGSQAVVSSLDASNTGYGIYANGAGTGKWELWLGNGSAQSFMSPAIPPIAEVVAGQIVALTASYDATTTAATLTVTPIMPPGTPSTQMVSGITYVTNLRIAASSIDQPPAEFFTGVLANIYVCPS
jgi:hypothetical protein